MRKKNKKTVNLSKIDLQFKMIYLLIELIKLLIYILDKIGKGN